MTFEKLSRPKNHKQILSLEAAISLRKDYAEEHMSWKQLETKYKCSHNVVAMVLRGTYVAFRNTK
jgi:hypothetical protein